MFVTRRSLAEIVSVVKFILNHGNNEAKFGRAWRKPKSEPSSHCCTMCDEGYAKMRNIFFYFLIAYLPESHFVQLPA